MTPHPWARVAALLILVAPTGLTALEPAASPVTDRDATPAQVGNLFLPLDCLGLATPDGPDGPRTGCPGELSVALDTVIDGAVDDTVEAGGSGLSTAHVRHSTPIQASPSGGAAPGPGSSL